MKIYISGKITGKKYSEALRDFRLIESHIWQESKLIPINPMNFTNPNMNYEECMKRCFELIEECQYIYLMRDWHNSEGSIKELNYALSLGLKVIENIYEG